MNDQNALQHIRIGFEQINRLVDKESNIDLDYLASVSSGIVHLNDVETFAPVFIDRHGLEKAEMSIEEINLQGFGFLEKIIEPTNLPVLIKDLTTIKLSGDFNKPFLFFQKYRLSTKEEYRWVITSMQYNQRLNKLFCIDFDLAGIDSNGSKLRRIGEENIFKSMHYQQYYSLTKREIEILRLIALGENNQQISDTLFLSKDTVRTHRNHIWQKLDIRNLVDAIKYAQAFDII